MVLHSDNGTRICLLEALRCLLWVTSEYPVQISVAQCPSRSFINAVGSELVMGI